MDLIVVPSINDTHYYDSRHSVTHLTEISYAGCRYGGMLSCITLKAIILNVNMLNVITFSSIMMSVIKLSIVLLVGCYVECHYSERHMLSVVEPILNNTMNMKPLKILIFKNNFFNFFEKNYIC
jgi:hypothetical protein